PDASSVVAPPGTASWIESAVPNYQAPADSFLIKALAWSRATTLLSAAIEESGPAIRTEPNLSRAVLGQLNALIEPFSALNVTFSIASLRRLISRMESGAMPPDGFAAALDDLVTRFRDELALTRIVTLPGAGSYSPTEPLFGPLVER